MVDVLGPTAAADLLRGPLASTGDTGLGVAWDRPLLVVDVTGATAPLDLRPPAAAPVIVVAVARSHPLPPPPPGADVCLAPAGHPLPRPWVAPDAGVDHGIDHLATAVAAHPVAAAVLAQILRARPHLDLADALVAESLAYSVLQAGADHRRWLTGQPPPRPPIDQPPIRLGRRGNSLEITLSRPQRRNAFSAATRDALIDALGLAAADPSIDEVRLSGDGPCFSAGGDLDEFGTADDPATAHVVRTTRSTGLAITTTPARTIASVHGPCHGAGVELPAFADHVIADPATTFTLPELTMGLIPGAGGTASLPPRIGTTRTAWLALTGHPLDTATALDWGLVDEVATTT